MQGINTKKLPTCLPVILFVLALISNVMAGEATWKYDKDNRLKETQEADRIKVEHTYDKTGQVTMEVMHVAPSDSPTADKARFNKEEIQAASVGYDKDKPQALGSGPADTLWKKPPQEKSRKNEILPIESR